MQKNQEKQMSNLRLALRTKKRTDRAKFIGHFRQMFNKTEDQSRKTSCLPIWEKSIFQRELSSVSLHPSDDQRVPT